MADKSFGVKELNLLNASGTPTVTSPNNLNLNANTVAISTSATVGNNLTVTSTTNSATLNVTGIGTLTRGFATDLSVSGISTISQPSNANPHSLWDVVNNSASAYRFTGPGQDGAEDNPNIYLVRGQRYIFKVNASGHPFQLRVANGGAAYSDGVTNNGAQSGNVVINVQHDAPAQLYYQCTSHGGMVGNIYIVGGPQVISGVVTATSFVGNLTGNVTGTASANAVLTGSTNNTLVTVTGANAITGEANLTFNGGATGDAQLTVHAEQNDSGADSELILETSNDFATSVVMFKDSTAEAGSIAYNHGDNYIKLSTNGTNGGTERLRIDSSGRVLIGTTTEGEGTADDLTIATSGTTGITIRSGTSGEGNIFFSDGTSGAAEYAGTIQYSHASNYMLFFTGAAERVRINSSGHFLVGVTGSPSTNGFAVLDTYQSTTYLQIAHNVTGAEYSYFNFNHNGSTIGTIKQNNAGNAISFNTSSDYRLKENVVSISDGITRLKTLKPSRFNFKNDTGTTVDGFLAHEVTAVPEAITGTKDEVDSDNNPVYQGIDQSKLVPLLTAALQEAITKIETREAKVSALEGS